MLLGGFGVADWDLVELGGELLASHLAQRLLDEPAGIATGRSGKSPCLHGGRALRTDDDFNRLHAAPPNPPPTELPKELPTWMVSLMEPLSNFCSVSVWPIRRASMRAFSTA